MEKLILKILILTFNFIIISFYIYKKVYINHYFTCNNYILNTYLYLILSIILTLIIILLIEQYIPYIIKKKENIYNLKNLKYFVKYFWIHFLLTVGFLMLTFYINPKYIVFKHFSWFILTILLGITLFPIYIITQKNNEFLLSTITTLLLVIFLTSISFYKPELISLSWGPILTILIIIGIVMKIMNLFLNKNKKSQNKWGYRLSYMFIVIFSFLLMYDNKNLQIKSKKCKIPDYINESISIFLDIINLFGNIGRINIK